MNSSYILTANTLTLFYNGKVYTTQSHTEEWNNILESVKQKDWDDVVARINRLESVRAYVGTTTSGLTVTDTDVMWQGKPLHGAIVARILSMKAQGFDIAPMSAFLKNLQDNPSYRSREQLYGFLENNALPITPDGCFMAYKRVKSNGYDVYSDTNYHAPGAVIRMNRNDVDDDPTRTCSAGLHVASLGYLAHFGGDALIAVKVNPKNVVAVPTDYHNSKMRVCEYEVVQELPMSVIDDNRDFWDKAVVDNEDDEEDEYEEEDSCYADEDDPEDDHETHW
jgi:hypothetical protein